MGFVDMSGDLGRRFGGLGLTLSGIQTRINVSRAPEFAGYGHSSARAVEYARLLSGALALEGGICIEIEEAIPEHVGLGSGTQLALAVSAAVARLHEIDIGLSQLAVHLRRGIRSGIGVGAFESGGFIVDGGRGENTVTPPVICHLPFPESWRILLVFDHTQRGLSGASEVAAFKDLPPMSPGHSGQLCRQLVMQLLPALVERDFGLFSRAIASIQEQVGDFFSPCQGGRFSSPRVAEVMGWLKGQGVQGVGQSSWGPTGFAFIEDAAQSKMLLQAASKRWRQPLSFMVRGARNHGAEIAVKETAVRSGVNVQRV
jgi:beta-RFAP synthase